MSEANTVICVERSYILLNVQDCYAPRLQRNSDIVVDKTECEIDLPFSVGGRGEEGYVP